MTTSSETPARRTMARILELDGVRGLAIAMVLIYHYAEIPDAAVSLGAKTLFGSKALFYAFVPTRLMWSGVDLFFVLSGFLIGGILLDHRDSDRYYSVFYARRIHRIFPIYYLMIALVSIGVWLWPNGALFRGGMPMWLFPLYAQNLTGNYTAAPDAIEVTWSLAVEEQFYLLFPFIVRLCSKRTLLYFLGVCVIGAPLLRTLMILNGSGFESVYPLLPARADTLALGVIAAILVRSEAATAWVKQHRGILYLTMAGLFALTPTILKWTTYIYSGTIGYSLMGFAYFTLILSLLMAPLPLMNAAFSAGWLRWLGRVSYCAYLIHQSVRAGIFMLLLPGREPVIDGPKSIFATVLALAATLAIAQVSWLVLEQKLVRRAHLRYRY
jgi:peptidoglycan/LPS O-acetylase OafA/YrhL